jgi:hypothetical protein
MKSYSHVKMVNVDNKREYFTTHGLHMNNKGKEITALRIGNTISSLFHKQNTSVIKLGWTADREESARVTLYEDSSSVQEEISIVAPKIDSVNCTGRGSKNEHPQLHKKMVVNKSMSGNKGIVTTRLSKPSGTRSEDDSNMKNLLIHSEGEEHKSTSGNKTQNSARLRKPPVTRSEDFLW